MPAPDSGLASGGGAEVQRYDRRLMPPRHCAKRAARWAKAADCTVVQKGEHSEKEIHKKNGKIST